MSSHIVWSPSTQWIEQARLTAFARQNGFASEPYSVLHHWSISQPDAFWGAVWDFCQVVGTRGRTVFVPPADGGMLGSRWFPEARLNFAENLLRGADQRLALILADETGVRQRVTMGQLRAEVARVADGLRALGVVPGDCVGGVVPNTFEALVALLAAASVGAIWSSCSPDFGAAAIIDRLGQIQPKVIFSARHYRYGGKVHDIGARLGEIARAIPQLRCLVLAGSDQPPAGVETVPWSAFGTPGAALRFEPLPFSHPLYVLYTSGTTGKPKAIIHSAGGVLLQHLKEHQLHCDLKQGDIIGWYTNTAWMMYHWLISGLASGAAIILSDGAPVVKQGGALDAGLLWRVMAETGATHFGISPKYLNIVAAQNYAPGACVDLSSLRVLMSAGAPVSPEQYDWIYQTVKSDLMFASISGGTEINGCFMIGAPTLPVRRGQLTCKALGHAVVVLDERNAPVIGRRGELCCTEPFPSMPLTFWGADGDQRFRAAYFAERPGIWTHGDWAEETIYGSGIIYGRSDTTLKPGGVRIGTAEIYAAVDRLAEVEDCLVFGVPVEGDEEIVLCLKLRDGIALSADLAERARRAIRESASPRHVPHRVHQVPGIPYTLNGKRVEAAAKAVVTGNPVKNRDSLANPEVLDSFLSLAQGLAF